MQTNILGISAYYHDSAATILQDGQLSAAAQEERFTRKKHDANFPLHAIKYCLSECDLEIKELSHIVFYDKPLLKFERLLETYLSYAPKGIRSFIASMPVWLKEKLYLKTTLKRELSQLAGCEIKDLPPLLFSQHHLSHAASAFYPSPFDEAVVLCMDGVGEWATTSAWHGKNKTLTPLWQINFPHSLGLLYSAFTYYTGFKVNSGEYKLMGLAPYGRPIYVQDIKNHLIDIKDDGSFRLDLSYFNYCTGLTMTSRKFHKLFGGPARKPESEVTQKEMDLAASIQVITEEVVLKIANSLHEETGIDNLCLAGGVALNCVCNGELQRKGAFKKIWVQPAAGDAGGAIGAAYTAWHHYLQEPRTTNGQDSMKGSYLGPKFENDEIERTLNKLGANYVKYDEDKLYEEVAKNLEQEKVIGWFQGRMEFGPRALGGRSIIGDPRSKNMQTTMNLKIKYRESFRPFAPSILNERANDYFEQIETSPYMLIVSPLQEAHRVQINEQDDNNFGIDKLKIIRSTLPAITHVDYSARIQTVHKETNPRYYKLIKKFEELTTCPILVNTSFNVRGEPIVCTPEDAYRCFMRTEMDSLVIEDFLLEKVNQPKIDNDDEWKNEFELD
jgi:carbamoyltransferase